MKSLVLTAEPPRVATLTLPDVADGGTVAVNDVPVADEITAGDALNSRRFRFATVSKFVPLTVTLVPATPEAGETPEIVGALDAVTVNGAGLIALPPGVVTAMYPVDAPAGTLVTICVVVELVTVAVTPLNVTVFWEDVALNPVPYSVTVPPTELESGLNPKMETTPAFCRVIDSRLPTAS